MRAAATAEQIADTIAVANRTFAVVSGARELTTRSPAAYHPTVGDRRWANTTANDGTWPQEPPTVKRLPMSVVSFAVLRYAWWRRGIPADELV